MYPAWGPFSPFSFVFMTFPYLMKLKQSDRYIDTKQHDWAGSPKDILITLFSLSQLVWRCSHLGRSPCIPPCVSLGMAQPLLSYRPKQEPTEWCYRKWCLWLGFPTVSTTPHCLGGPHCLCHLAFGPGTVLPGEDLSGWPEARHNAGWLIGAHVSFQTRGFSHLRPWKVQGLELKALLLFVCTL